MRLNKNHMETGAEGHHVSGTDCMQKDGSHIIGCFEMKDGNGGGRLLMRTRMALSETQPPLPQPTSSFDARMPRIVTLSMTSTRPMSGIYRRAEGEFSRRVTSSRLFMPIRARSTALWIASSQGREAASLSTIAAWTRPRSWRLVSCSKRRGEKLLADEEMPCSPKALGRKKVPAVTAPSKSALITRLGTTM